jgi:2-succinyl-5-enolpyruvyl-6-hydroxy-3-cyclohexene-1-carboxylate synthase
MAGMDNTGAALRLLQALRRHGLAWMVICPGSRSAPLAVAAGLLEARGLRLHTAIDERSAAFFALGIGRALGRPAAVITTSGTAVANLLPAAVEADHGTIPLLLISADRPARLKGCGANQSVNQEEFLRPSCRWVGQGNGRGLAEMKAPELERLASEAMAGALGRGPARPRAPGPVHLNLALEEPLHPGGPRLLELGGTLAGELAHEPAQRTAGTAAGLEDRAEGAGKPMAAPSAAPMVLDPDRPGVVVAGPWRGNPAAWDSHVNALRHWQRFTGWPVLADALSGLRGLGDLELIGAYDLVLEAPPPQLAAPQVLRLGPLPASRRLQRWLEQLEGVQVLVSEGDPRPLDPLGRVMDQRSGGLAAWLHEQGLPGPPAGSAAAGFAGGGTREGTAARPVARANRDLALQWRSAEARVQTMLARELSAAPVARGWGEPGLARWLSRRLPADRAVLLANSSPVRDWDLFADPAAPRRDVHSFRGASGIDGTLSIAAGLASALGGLVLVTGDLALLHDGNGWLWRSQLRGPLTVVLIDNGGGGIFEQLPIRTEPEAAMDFERLFAMPQGIDACALAAVHGVPGRWVRDGSDLAPALAWALERPMALVAVRTDRRVDAAQRLRLRTMAAEELAQP